MKEKNFGLTKETFDALVLDMRDGKEDLFEKIFLSHFERCMIYLQQNYGLTHEQSYDASMETLLEFRKGLINNKYVYGNLNFLFTKMASQKFFKASKREMIYSPLAEGIDVEVAPMVLDEDEISILNRAWNKLGNNCQLLLKMFYYENRKLKELADEASKTPASMRKQKERCMNALRINFQSLLKA